MGKGTKATHVPLPVALGRMIQAAIALCGGAFIVLAGVVTMNSVLDQNFGNKWWPIPFMVGVLAVALVGTRALLPAAWRPEAVRMRRTGNRLWDWELDFGPPPR